ncbi:MAG: NUDIX domain-containing protein [Thermotogota bacterium]|nr:NUDIX domain-containing protein [Thermotogota bacterium]
MELWDVLDENRNKTGRLVERENPDSLLGPGEYHLVVFAFIRNHDGRFLISKRAPNKTFPNMWEITGGSAVTGDDSERAIFREIKEELGIDVDPEKGRLLKSFKIDDERSFFADIWYFDHDVDLSQVVCQPEEVTEAKLASKDEILGMVDDGTFAMNWFVLECLESLS